MRMSKLMTNSFCLLGLIVVSVGCSDSSETTESSMDSETLQAPQVTLTTDLPSDSNPQLTDVSAEDTEPPQPATPQFVVQNFLAALQSGADDEISNLLTTRAKQETEKHDLVVRSPGSPDATFEVGGVEMVSGGAYVTSLWKEPGKDGLTHQFDIIWILRQQSDGWRIAGMATRVAAHEAPTYLNFEEPEEMIRIWQEADRRLATQQGEGGAVGQVDR